jgi:hypothetical protein
MAFKPKETEIDLENPNSNIVAIIDGDWPVYSIACVGDDNYVEITHTPSGSIKEFKTKTEFHGRSKKTVGGWLGEINTDRRAKEKTQSRSGREWR